MFYSAELNEVKVTHGNLTFQCHFLLHLHKLGKLSNSLFFCTCADVSSCSGFSSMWHCWLNIYRLQHLADFAEYWAFMGCLSIPLSIKTFRNDTRLVVVSVLIMQICKAICRHLHLSADKTSLWTDYLGVSSFICLISVISNVGTAWCKIED